MASFNFMPSTFGAPNGFGMGAGMPGSGSMPPFQPAMPSIPMNGPGPMMPTPQYYEMNSMPFNPMMAPGRPMMYPFMGVPPQKSYGQSSSQMGRMFSLMESLIDKLLQRKGIIPASSTPSSSNTTTLDGSDTVNSTTSTQTTTPTELERNSKAIDYSNNTSLATQDFNNMDLRDCNFSGVKLTDYKEESSSFAGSNLTRAKFDNADLGNVDFSNTILTGAKFGGRYFQRNNFENADIRGTDFSNLFNWQLDGCNLTGAKYNSQTKFPENFDPTAHGMIEDNSVEFDSSLLDERETSKPEVKKSNIDLTERADNNYVALGQDYTSGNLSGGDWSGSTFDGSTLMGANITSCDLGTDDARSTSFRGSMMQGACLLGSRLKYTDFRGADLRQAMFGGEGKFRHIYFQGADLRGTTFSGNDGNTWPDLEDFQSCTWTGALLDSTTVLPKGFRPIGAILVNDDGSRTTIDANTPLPWDQPAPAATPSA